jgi:hypothetical protein
VAVRRSFRPFALVPARRPMGERPSPGRKGRRVSLETSPNIRPHGSFRRGIASLFYPYNNEACSTSNSYPLVASLEASWRFEMGQQLAKVAYVLAFLVVKARAAVANARQTAMADQADRYRPEAHYMRGPGPKWRAKHAQVSIRR